jgi:hypothetical protein
LVAEDQGEVILALMAVLVAEAAQLELLLGLAVQAHQVKETPVETL